MKTAVFEIISRIPAGKVATYGQIARMLSLKNPRIIGAILHRNKSPELFPCHRVVFKDGSLSKSYLFGGEEAQRKKLTDEKVKFLNSGKVDLKSCLISDL